MTSLEITLYLVLFIASFLAIGKYDYEKKTNWLNISFFQFYFKNRAKGYQ